MMIKKIDHIGIAAEDLEKQIKFYTKILGLTCAGIEEVADQQVKVALFPIAEVRIELLQPTSDDSVLAKFLKNKGEGIHHIAYQITDLEANLQRLEQQQVQLIDRHPRIGAGGYKIAFLHPKSTSGVLIELCEH